MTLWTLSVAAFALTVAIWDLASRRIPKALLVAGFAAGLLFHGFQHDLPATLLAVGAAFLLSIFLFHSGAFGGGDAKLIIAMAAILGGDGWVFALATAFIIFALLGLGQAVWSGRVREAGGNMRTILRHMRHFGLRAHDTLHVRESSCMRAPFGVAACLGMLGFLWLGRPLWH